MYYLRSNLFISKTPLLSACNSVLHLKSFLNICWREQTDHIFILCLNNIGHTISFFLNVWYVLFKYDCIYDLCVIFPNILYCFFFCSYGTNHMPAHFHQPDLHKPCWWQRKAILHLKEQRWGLLYLTALQLGEPQRNFPSHLEPGNPRNVVAHCFCSSGFSAGDLNSHH